MILLNVHDRRHDWIGSWEADKLNYNSLAEGHIGRTVIYKASHGDPEAGTLTSFRNGVVWARFHKGDTAASCNPADLWLATKPLDGDLTR